MGSLLSTPIQNFQQEMKKKQMMMKKRQMRMQFASRIAFMRDMVRFYGTFYATAWAGAFLVTAKTKQFPKTAIPALVVFSFVLAYQWDLAYGNKLQRVSKYRENILADGRYFFNDPDFGPKIESEKKEDKDKGDI